MANIVLFVLMAMGANFIVSRLGPGAAPWVALGLIGPAMTTRDTVHDMWEGRGVFWRMAILVGTASILSCLFDKSVALASFIAFFVSGMVDTAAYHLLREKRYLVRVNGSNLISTFVDSLLFLSLAFGWPPRWEFVFLQFGTKVLGGFVWSWIVSRRKC